MRETASKSRIVLRLAILLLASLFIVATVVVLALLETLQDPATYENSLQSLPIAERRSGPVIEFIITNSFRGSTEVKLPPDISSRTWQQVADSLIIVNWLDDELERNVTATFEWLEDTVRSNPTWVFDLKPIKEALLGPRGARAMLFVLAQIPPCPEEHSGAPSGGEKGEDCLPAGMDLSDGAVALAGAVSEALDDELSRSTLLDWDPSISDTLERLQVAKRGIRTLGVVLWVGLIASGLLLLLYAAMSIRSLVALPEAVSGPVLLAGFLSLLLLGVFDGVLRMKPELLLVGDLLTFPPHQQGLAIEVMGTIGPMFEREWLAWSAILLGAGVVLRIPGWVVSALEPKKTETAEELPLGRRIRKQFR